MELKDELIHLERQVQLLVMRYKELVHKNRLLDEENKRLGDALAQAKQSTLDLADSGIVPTSGASLSFGSSYEGTHVFGMHNKTKKQLLDWIDQHIDYIELCIAHLQEVPSRATEDLSK